jgi:hypothetical protein
MTTAGMAWKEAVQERADFAIEARMEGDGGAFNQYPSVNNGIAVANWRQGLGMGGLFDRHAGRQRKSTLISVKSYGVIKWVLTCSVDSYL